MVLACGLSACKAPAPSTGIPGENNYTPGPGAGVPPAEPLAGQEFGPPLAGEDHELIRRLIAQASTAAPCPAEDYEAGPILMSSFAPDSAEGKSSASLRALLKQLQEGRWKAPARKGFVERLLEENQELFREVMVVRLLARHQVGDGRAAYALRLLGLKGSARLTAFLEQGEAAPGEWKLSDLQGELSAMADDTEKLYSGYVPQDIERTLIREDKGRPWL